MYWMNEVLHANIFFVIASIATLVFCVFICFILYHVYKIARALRRIVDRIEAGSELIAEDVAFVRSFVHGGLANLFSFFGSTARTRKRKVKSDDEEDV